MMAWVVDLEREVRPVAGASPVMVPRSPASRDQSSEGPGGPELREAILAAARTRNVALVPWLLEVALTHEGLAGKMAVDALGRFGKAAAGISVPLAGLLIRLIDQGRFSRAAGIVKLLMGTGDRDPRVNHAILRARHSRGSVNRARVQARKALSLIDEGSVPHGPLRRTRES